MRPNFTHEGLQLIYQKMPEVKQTFFIVEFASYTSSKKELKKERKKHTYEMK